MRSMTEVKIKLLKKSLISNSHHMINFYICEAAAKSLKVINANYDLFLMTLFPILVPCQTISCFIQLLILESRDFEREIEQVHIRWNEQISCLILIHIAAGFKRMEFCSQCDSINFLIHQLSEVARNFERRIHMNCKYHQKSGTFLSHSYICSFLKCQVRRGGGRGMA